MSTSKTTRRFPNPIGVFVLVLGFSAATCDADITTTSFGSGGEAGFVHNREVTFGAGGAIYELDSFLNIEGVDLNGSRLGTSAQLSRGEIPASLAFQFSPIFSHNNSVLCLTYTFRNVSNNDIDEISFFSFVDPEIDSAINTYFNEFGEITGAIGFGFQDSKPDQFEIDEPSYVFGDIFENLLFGNLDNINNVPNTFPDDPSFSLAFSLGSLRPNDQATIKIYLSDSGFAVNDFWLTHRDLDSISEHLTISGKANIVAVPEPTGMSLLLIVYLATTLLCSARRSR